MTAAFAHVRILDFTRDRAGPYGTYTGAAGTGRDTGRTADRR
jgi:hypothetical protein